MTDGIHETNCGCLQLRPSSIPLALQTESNAKHVVTVRQNSEFFSIAFSDTSLTVTSIKPNGTEKLKHATTPYHVLWANLTGSRLILAFIEKGKRKARNVCINAPLQGSTKEEAADWVEDLLDLAYHGVKRGKKLKVLVNPSSGKGKSIKLFSSIVRPTLELGRSVLDVTFTTHRGHAAEIVKEIALDFDAIVVVSGDGLAHEVLNGFAEHDNPQAAFAIPLVPVPTGSGNGCCISLLGLEDGLDPVLASLNAIKGKYMRSDLCSITQNGRRIFSYMSVSMGLMADVDIKTEHLRWMGDTRFVYGFLRGIIQQRPYPMKISLRVSERDKHKMHDTYQAIWQKPDDGKTCWDNLLPSEKLPPLKHSEADTNGWEDIDVPVLFFYSGLIPYVSRDLLQWPLALPNDGLIDVSVQETAPMSSLIADMGAAPQGGPYWSNTQHFFKVEAYRVKTLGPGFISVDGENTPCGDFQVEVHKGMCAFLSPSGRFGVHFNYPPPPSK